MLTIRLTRKGKKNQPFFRVVVIDSKRSANGGRAVEDLGYVDPLTKKRNFKKERVLYWLKNGAKPSASIHNLLVTDKIIDSKKIVKKSKKPASAESSGVAKPAIGTPKEEAKPEVAPEVPAESPKAEETPKQ